MSLRTRLLHYTRKTSFRIVIFVGTVVVSIAILGMMVYRQREALLDLDWRLRPIPLLLSFGLFSLDLILVAKVWGWIMNVLASKLGFWKHFRYFSISNLAKRVPGAIWYIASRAQLYKGEGISRKRTSLASGVEVAVSVISGILVSLFFAIPIISRYQLSFWALGIALAVSGILVHPKVLAWALRKLGSDASLFGYADLVKWVASYVFAWMLGGGILLAISNIFIPVPIFRLWYMIGSWALVGVVSTAFFFSPTNLGVTEVGLSLLLTSIMPSSIAVLVAIATRILVLSFEIFWALVSFGLKPRDLGVN